MLRSFGCAAIVLALLSLPTAAQAVTLRDVVELTKAGLDDEIIVALVQTDNTIYGLDARRLIELRRAGVSERVLLALLKNGRDEAPAAERPETFASSMPAAPDPVPVAPAPQVIVIDHQQAPAVVPFYVPVFVNAFPTPVARPGHAVVNQPYLPGGGFGRFINDGFRPAVTPPAAPPSGTPGSFGRFLNDGSRPPDPR